jgi:hypothetical protein
VNPDDPIDLAYILCLSLFGQFYGPKLSCSRVGAVSDALTALVEAKRKADELREARDQHGLNEHASAALLLMKRHPTVIHARSDRREQSRRSEVVIPIPKRRKRDKAR